LSIEEVGEILGVAGAAAAGSAECYLGTAKSGFGPLQVL
jgi:hypothetical protein